MPAGFITENHISDCLYESFQYLLRRTLNPSQKTQPCCFYSISLSLSSLSGTTQSNVPLLSSIPMAEPETKPDPEAEAEPQPQPELEPDPISVRYDMNAQSRFFLCRFCGNHVVTMDNCIVGVCIISFSLSHSLSIYITSFLVKCRYIFPLIHKYSCFESNF